MKRSLLIGVMALWFTSNTFGQDDPWVPTVDQLVSIPGSPEAAAFAEYGKTPVSHYNGTPNISVPIGMINGRSFSVPLSLTYDASGIKVEQIASSAGLGWNLNVGGMVVRQVNGLPDDYIWAVPEYYPHYSGANHNLLGPSSVNTYYDYFLNNTMTGGSHSTEMLEAYGRFTMEFEDRKLDIQPDTYSFHAPGLSGSFYIDYDDLIASDANSKTYRGVSINGPELEIEVRVDGPDGFGVEVINLVTVINNQGTRYIFQTPETSFIRDQDQDGKWREYTSSWFLSFIYTANDRDEVLFQYVAGTYWTNEQYLNRGDVLRGLITETAECTKTSTPSSSAAPTHRVNQPTLDKIYVNSRQRASFTYDTRTDVDGKKRISRIDLFKEDGSSLDVVKFHNETNFESQPTTTNEFQRRLKLDGISFWGANGVAENDPSMRRDYAFEYDESMRLPSRDSRSQDYWGFYNGQSHTQSLIPSNASYDLGTLFSGGNRTTDLAHTRAGVLTKITYPTGGFSEFHYQGNRVIGDPVVDNQSTLQKVYSNAGGLDGIVDDSNPAVYNSCDDNGTTEMPGLFTDSFSVNESGAYQLEIDITAGISGTTNEDVMRFFLYEGAAKTYCELKTAEDTGTDHFILQSESINTPTNILNTHVFDQHKTYRVLIISNSVDVAYGVFRNEVVTNLTRTSNFPVGGLRIYKTVDKPNAAETAITRYFYYEDLKPEVDSNTPLTDNFFASSTATSAVLQQPVNMETQSPSEARDEDRFYVCDYVNRLSTNQYRPLGGTIGYSKVTEVTWANDQINGFTVYTFNNQDRSTQLQTTGPSLNGRVIQEIIYDKDGNKVQQTDSEYEAIGLVGTGGLVLRSSMHGYYDMKPENGRAVYTRVRVDKLNNEYGMTPCLINNADCLRPSPQNIYEQNTYAIGEGWLRLKKTTQTSYDGTEPVVKVTEHAYETSPVHYQPVTIQVTEGDQQVYTTYLYYPDDLVDPYMANLVSANRRGEVIESVEYLGDDNTGVELRRKKTSFQLVGASDIHPHKLYFSQKGQPLEDRIEYISYDEFGNPLEIKQVGGISTAFVWGYGKKHMVARVVNATQAQVETALVAGYNLGTGGLTTAQSNALRAIAGAQVMIMTYDTGYGITSQTDPNGKTTTFEYDDLGRLKLVKDFEGNIVSTNTYHYRGH